MGNRCEIVLSWKLQNLTDEKSTSVQLNAWCHRKHIGHVSVMQIYRGYAAKRALSAMRKHGG